MEFQNRCSFFKKLLTFGELYDRITNDIIQYYEKSIIQRKGEFIMTFVEKYGKILLPLITPYKENEEVDYDQYAIP